MKAHKAPLMSGLVAEMLKVAGDFGMQWMICPCHDLVRAVCIPSDWQYSMLLPIFKGKEDPVVLWHLRISCGLWFI